MQKSVVVSFAIAVICFLLFFVFLAICYFVGTQRSEQVSKAQCHCQHLSNKTVPKENEGSKVDADDLRYTVSFFNRLKNNYDDIIYSHFCSGIRLNPTMILTSYHCFDPNVRLNSSEDSAGIPSNQHDLYSMFTTETNHRKVVKVHFSEHAKKPENDLAIVEIDRPFSNDTGVSFACLIGRRIDSVNASIKYFSSGFGFEKRMLNLPEEREYLKKNSKVEWQFSLGQPEYALQIMRLDSEPCRSANSTSLICASSKNASTCIGDTGISILYELNDNVYVVGISGGLKDKQSGCSYAEFASIYSNLNWINQITGGDICSPEVHTTNGFNEFMLRLGIAYFVVSAVLLVLLTSLLKQNSLGLSKNKQKAELVIAKKLEDGQNVEKKLETPANDVSELNEDEKKVDEGMAPSESSKKQEDDHSQNSLKT